MSRDRGIRVLVVDDSAVVRRTLRERLLAEPDIEAVDTATDGRVALRKLERLSPDVITMDVEMPVLDGLATLKQIMHRDPRPVIMLSAYTFEGARKTIRALELGAVDFIPKPGGPASRGLEEILIELTAKLRAVARTDRAPRRGGSQRASTGGRTARPSPIRAAPPGGPAGTSRAAAAEAAHRASRASLPVTTHVAQLAAAGKRVVVCGASTGGTEAIRHLLRHIPARFPAGVVITQHMPARFTQAFAQRLDELLELKVKEASHHDVILPGRVLIAPGHSHLTVHFDGETGYVKLDRRPRVSGHRPSVDVLFESAAAAFGACALGVLLTGMGRDGARGLLALHEAGAATAAQDESTSVVFGMPKAAIDAGAAQQVLPLPRIPGWMARWASRDLPPTVGPAAPPPPNSSLPPSPNPTREDPEVPS